MRGRDGPTKAVVFDFGYTLVNEDRVWATIAAQYGWPASVFFATLGAVIERRGRHRDVFELLGATEPHQPVPFEPRDFYEDALPSIAALKRKGWVVGIAGNMGTEIERFLSRHVGACGCCSGRRRYAGRAQACGVRKLVRRPGLPLLQRDPIYAPHMTSPPNAARSHARAPCRRPCARRGAPAAARPPVAGRSGAVSGRACRAGSASQPPPSWACRLSTASILARYPAPGGVS
jgi:hypothetical protein